MSKRDCTFLDWISEHKDEDIQKLIKLYEIEHPEIDLNDTDYAKFENAAKSFFSSFDEKDLIYALNNNVQIMDCLSANDRNKFFDRMLASLPCIKDAKWNLHLQFDETSLNLFSFNEQYEQFLIIRDKYMWMIRDISKRLEQHETRPVFGPFDKFIPKELSDLEMEFACLYSTIEGFSKKILRDDAKRDREVMADQFHAYFQPKLPTYSSKCSIENCTCTETNITIEISFHHYIPELHRSLKNSCYGEKHDPHNWNFGFKACNNHLDENNHQFKVPENIITIVRLLQGHLKIFYRSWDCKYGEIPDYTEYYDSSSARWCRASHTSQVKNLKNK